MVRSLVLASLLGVVALATTAPASSRSSAGVGPAPLTAPDPFSCPFCGGGLGDFRLFVRTTLLVGLRATIVSPC